MNIDELRTRIAGRVIEPGDPVYDDARKLFYGGMDRKPAHIVRVADAADVARTIAFARDSGLELAVRSGGHRVVGHSISDGGVRTENAVEFRKWHCPVSDVVHDQRSHDEIDTVVWDIREWLDNIRDVEFGTVTDSALGNF